MIDLWITTCRQVGLWHSYELPLKKQWLLKPRYLVELWILKFGFTVEQWLKKVWILTPGSKTLLHCKFMEPTPHKPTPSLHPEQIWLHAWINIAINKFKLYCWVSFTGTCTRKQKSLTNFYTAISAFTANVSPRWPQSARHSSRSRHISGIH
jgi:hypothetical protein